MRNQEENTGRTGKSSIRLKQVVTPNHIKVYAETPTTDTFKKLAQKEPVTTLQKMGVAVVGLLVAIVALLVPWGKSDPTIEIGVAEAKEPDVAPAPVVVEVSEVKPTDVVIEEIVHLSASATQVVQPRLATVEDRLRPPSPAQDVVVASRPAPVPSQAPTIESAPASFEPAAPLTARPDPEPEPTPEASEVAIAPPSVLSEMEETDIVKRAAFGTLAALRNDGTQDLVAFVQRAQDAGTTTANLQVQLDAAHAAGKLRVPARLLSDNGQVDLAAVLHLVEAQQ